MPLLIKLVREFLMTQNNKKRQAKHTNTKTYMIIIK